MLSQEILAKVIFKELKNDEEDKELNATITRIKTKQNVKKIQQMIHHDETYVSNENNACYIYNNYTCPYVCTTLITHAGRR